MDPASTDPSPPNPQTDPSSAIPIHLRHQVRRPSTPIHLLLAFLPANPFPPFTTSSRTRNHPVYAVPSFYLPERSVHRPPRIFPFGFVRTPSTSLPPIVTYLSPALTAGRPLVTHLERHDPSSFPPRSNCPSPPFYPDLPPPSSPPLDPLCAPSLHICPYVAHTCNYSALSRI